MTIRWPDVEPSCWSHVDPTSKVALGRRGLPTLGQRSECGPSTLGLHGPTLIPRAKLRWADVDCQRWVNEANVDRPHWAYMVPR